MGGKFRVVAAVALGLGLAFAVGTGLELLRFGKSGILSIFALRWELAGGVLFAGAWALPVLLASVASVAEAGDNRASGFVELARQELAPGLAVAALLSIFFIFGMPAAEGRREFFKATSAMFDKAYEQGERALSEGDPDRAEESARVCRGIDPEEPRYVKLDEAVRKAQLERAAARAATGAAREAAAGKPAAGGKSATGYYTDALKAFNAKKYYEAHYLAKKAAAIDPKRGDVRELVNSSWAKILSLTEDEAKKSEADFYRKKLEGYRYMQSDDWLSAYRLFLALSVGHGSDPDVRNYLADSLAGLGKTGFFRDEDEDAFANTGGRPFSMAVAVKDGRAVLSAAAAAYTIDGLYLRDLAYREDGRGVELRAPYGKIRATTLYLRMVDRNDPSKVWTPTWTEGPPPGGVASVLELEFGRDQAVEAFILSGPAHDVPPDILWKGLSAASSYGVDPVPIRVEFAARFASPFVAVILVLLGLAFGHRFKAAEPPGAFGFAFGVGFMSLAAAPTLGAVGTVALVLVRYLARVIGGGGFFVAWFGALAACTVASLFIAIRITKHAD